MRRGMIKEPSAPPAEEKTKGVPFATTKLEIVGPAVEFADLKQVSLFGPQDEVLNALELEISSAIVEIERLEDQIEKRKTKIASLKSGRLDVLKGAREAAKKWRKDREKEINAEAESTS